MAKVKGIFFTFSGFFLAMLVIVLSLLVATTLNQSNLRLGESGSLERMYALDVSIERILVQLDDGIELLSYYEGQTQDTLLAFTETLDEDYDDYNSEFLSDIRDLRDYIESDQPEIQFNLSLIDNPTEKVPLAIEPSKFRYTHLNRSGETILAIYPGTLVARTRFILNLTNTTIDPREGIDWTTQNEGEELTVNITAYDMTGYNITRQEIINTTGINEFQIGEVVITFNEFCAGCIELDRNDANVTVNFRNNFLFTGELVTVNYPQGMYVLNFSDIGIFINATARIL